MKLYRVDIIDINPYDVELEDMGDRSGKLDFCLASDVADLERRHREAVELLRSALSMTTDRLEEHMDDWIEWEDSTDAFLAEEEEA